VRSVFDTDWPQFEAALTVAEAVEIVVQVHGKVRGRVTLRVGRSLPTPESSATLPLEQQFGPSSVQLKGEINDALPRKRHQKRHLEFCIA
jgi:leucyl-tRNA synthetase